jgi:hypothetical protein
MLHLRAFRECKRILDIDAQIPNSAVSVARLRMTQGRDGEAKKILAPVYERFTDGYDTTDLRAARTMLDTIPK